MEIQISKLFNFKIIVNESTMAEDGIGKGSWKKAYICLFHSLLVL